MRHQGPETGFWEVLGVTASVLKKLSHYRGAVTKLGTDWKPRKV